MLFYILFPLKNNNNESLNNNQNKHARLPPSTQPICHLPSYSITQTAKVLIIYLLHLPSPSLLTHLTNTPSRFSFYLCTDRLIISSLDSSLLIIIFQYSFPLSTVFIKPLKSLMPYKPSAYPALPSIPRRDLLYLSCFIPPLHAPHAIF